MAVSFVSAGTPYQGTANVTSAGVVIPTIADGDTLIVLVAYAGGSTTNSCSYSGITKLGDQQASGITFAAYYKKNLVKATDEGATVTINRSTSGVLAIQTLIYRGADPDNPIDDADGHAESGQADQTITGNLSTATSTGSIALIASCVAASSTTAIPTADTSASGFTSRGIAASSFATANGIASIRSYDNLTPMSLGGSAGAVVWNSLAAFTINMASWTILLRPVAGATPINPVTPTSLTASTGWSNVGTAANIVAALSDADLATYAESINGPVASTNNLKTRMKLFDCPDGYILSGVSGVYLSCSSGTMPVRIQVQGDASAVIWTNDVTVTTTPTLFPIETGPGDTDAVDADDFYVVVIPNP